jgi:hypothetical protein
MCSIKIIVILLLIIIINYNSKNTEGFSSKQEIKKKAQELYSNKEMFKPGVKYSNIKKEMKWVDPIIYDDVYKLSLKENLSISNLENTLYNGIK